MVTCPSYEPIVKLERLSKKRSQKYPHFTKTKQNKNKQTNMNTTTTKQMQNTSSKQHTRDWARDARELVLLDVARAFHVEPPALLEILRRL
jgi:hypothetical protein